MPDPKDAEGFTYYLLEEVYSVMEKDQDDKSKDVVKDRKFHIIKTNEGREGLVAWMLARPDQIGAGFMVLRETVYPGSIMGFRRIAPGYEDNLVFYARQMSDSEQELKDVLKTKLAEVKDILKKGQN